MWYKYLLFIFFGIIIFYYKFILPIPFLSYENYHWINFLNNIYLVFDINILEYIYNQVLSNWPYDGHTNLLFYRYLASFFPNNDFLVFYIQSLFSLLSYLFFSLSVYFIFNKNKIISYILFLLLLTLPHQIKYWFSEDYYIFWNMLISLSVLFFVLLFEYKKIIFLILSLFTFTLSIYTRNLYLLYLPIFFIIILKYYSFYDFKKHLFWFKKNIINFVLFIISILVFIFPIVDRLSILFMRSEHFSKNTFDIVNDFESILNIFYWLFNNSFFNWYIFSILTFIGLLWFIYKNKLNKNTILFILFIIYIVFLVVKYQLMWTFSFNRHFILLEPFFLVLISLWFLTFYLFIKDYFKNKYINNSLIIIVTFLLLFQPIYYKEYILKNYSLHKEFLFIKDNVSIFDDKTNLIIPNSYIWGTSYEFPSYLIDNYYSKNINIYNIYWDQSNRYIWFNDNYNKINLDNNIFYLSTACYASWEFNNLDSMDNWIRKDCRFIIDNYKLSTIVEKSIYPETYFLPRIDTNLKELKIWFYKILEKNN